MYELTPLGMVQAQLVAHTDRRPADANAVMQTIRAGVDVALGNEALEFADRLTNSLDPYGRGGLGLRGVRMLERVGAVTLASGHNNIRMGGASLLGVLAMTHDPAVYDRIDAHPGLYRAQTASVVARQTLMGLTVSDKLPTQYASFTEAVLTQGPMCTQDVALELMLGSLGAALPVREERPPVQEAVTEKFELPAGMGVALGEEQDYILAPLSDHATDRLRRMDWIKKGLDLENSKGRKVFHDGSHVATIIDLTIAHPLLRKLKNELSESLIGPQFWSQLAISVAEFAKTGTHRRMPSGTEKVITFYGGNKHADENLFRYYFVPLGKGLSGASVVGLIAAFRGKQKQRKVLNTISLSPHPISER